MTSLGGGRRNLATSQRVVRAVLRKPALRRVEAAFRVFNAVEFGTWVAILRYAYGATGPGLVGIVALAQLVPASLFAPVAASLADRFPRERSNGWPPSVPRSCRTWTCRAGTNRSSPALAQRV